jgi:hypothetical protein
VDEAASAAVTVADEGTSYHPPAAFDLLKLIGVAEVDFEVAVEEDEGDLLDEGGCEAVSGPEAGADGAAHEVVLEAAHES